VGNLSASDLRCLAPGLFSELLAPLAVFLADRPLLYEILGTTSEVRGQPPHARGRRRRRRRLLLPLALGPAVCDAGPLEGGRRSRGGGERGATTARLSLRLATATAAFPGGLRHALLGPAAATHRPPPCVPYTPRRLQVPGITAEEEGEGGGAAEAPADAAAAAAPSPSAGAQANKQAAADPAGAGAAGAEGGGGGSARRSTRPVSGRVPPAGPPAGLLSCGPSATVSEVLEMVVSGHVHRVYVVGEGGRPLGVVTLTDLLQLVSEACG
jgi:hypothetical protein